MLDPGHSVRRSRVVSQAFAFACPAMGGKRKPADVGDPAQQPLRFTGPAASQSGKALVTEKAAKAAKTSADSQAGAKPSEPAPQKAKAEAKAKGKAAKAKAAPAKTAAKATAAKATPATATVEAKARVKASKTQAPAATEQTRSDTKAAAAAKAQPKGTVPADSQVAEVTGKAKQEVLGEPALALPKAGQTQPPVQAHCVERDALAEAAEDSDSEATLELPGTGLQRAADDFRKAEQEAEQANTAEPSSPAKGFEAQPKRMLPSPTLPADPAVSQASAKTESADSPLGVLAKSETQSLVEDLRGEALLKAAKTKLETEPQEPQSNEEVQSEDNFRCSAQRPQANQAGSETAEKDSAASQGGPLQEDGKLQPRKPAGENPSQASTGAVNVQSTPRARRAPVERAAGRQHRP